MKLFDNPRMSRIMFVISAFMIVLSLTFSTISVAKVWSAPSASVVTVPNKVGFEGFLADSSGNALTPDATHNLTFAVYSIPSGGSNLWSEIQTGIQVTKGLYSVQLGSANPLPANLFDGTRYISVAVDGGSELTPRTQVSSVPFALNAQSANTANSASSATTSSSASSAPWSGITGVPSALSFLAAPSSCTAGQASIWNGSSWICQTNSQVAYVQTNQTFSTTTLVDSALTFYVNSGETWAFMAMLNIGGGSGSGYKLGVNGPASPSLFLAQAMSGHAGSVGGAGPISAYGQLIQDTISSGGIIDFSVNGVVTSATSGWVTIQGAAVSGFSNPVLQKGSVLVATRK